MQAWVPNEERRLRAGLFANVDLEIARRDGAIIVPESAVVFDRQGTYVWRVDEEGLPSRAPIDLGLRKGGRVEVTMTGFKNEVGTARVAFFLDARVWPDGDSSIFATAVVPISDGQAVAVFEDVPAGPFAISVFHDEDSDGELNSAALGIPSEPYGFSGDARDLFGPAEFVLKFSS